MVRRQCTDASPQVKFMTRHRRKIHGLLPIVLGVTLAGCATVPPPTQLLERAQAEIRAARSAGAATAAPDALAEAERRLAAAQQFGASNDNGNATDKAEEAEAAAATARARAEAARLDGEISQQTSVNTELKTDLARRQAAAAAAQQAAMTPPSAASAGQPAAGSSAPVMLPSIQLGHPAAGASAGDPASPATSGGAPEVQP